MLTLFTWLRHCTYKDLTVKNKKAPDGSSQADCFPHDRLWVVAKQRISCSFQDGVPLAPKEVLSKTPVVVMNQMKNQNEEV